MSDNNCKSCEHYDPDSAMERLFRLESRCLEGVTTCVGFDDMLDVTLTQNHAHFDNFIVVTSHSDRKTQAVARKHGAMCVQTDLFRKNGRTFNKGAAINAGFDLFQFYGWRMHIDADIVLPDSFRRTLFNNTSLDQSSIHGADRMDVISRESIRELLKDPDPQHVYGLLTDPGHGKLAHRLNCSLRGYLPLGFLQLWHSRCQKPYPYSRGSAAHDDMIFAGSWPNDRRLLLPTVICYHLCVNSPKIGENWDGHRKQPRL